MSKISVLKKIAEGIMDNFPIEETSKAVGKAKKYIEERMGLMDDPMPTPAPGGGMRGPQVDLPRYIPKQGMSARVRDLIANPEVRKLMLNKIDMGSKTSAKDWYNTDPLYEEFTREWGKDVGPEKFKEFMDYLSATSAQSDIGTNVRNASYYFHKAETGEPFPEPGQNPWPYGHFAQKNHRSASQRIREGTSEWDPIAQPKRTSFSANLLGNFQPVTVDTHATRLPAMLSEDPRWLAKNVRTQNPDGSIVERWPAREHAAGELSIEDAMKQPGLWEGVPAKNEYAGLEGYYQDLGKEMGLNPAQTQASAWTGGGDITGLRSAPDPVTDIVNKRARYTAAIRGISPQQALQEAISGKRPFLALPAAGAAAGAAAAPQDLLGPPSGQPST